MSFVRNLLSRVHLSRPAKIGIAFGLIAAALLASVIYFLPKTQEVARDRQEEGAPVPVSYTASFDEGTHTVTGTVSLKNRCQPFDASAVLDESVTPAVVRVELLAGEDEGVCLEIPEERSFSVSVDGPEAAAVQVFVNGIPASGEAI